MLLGFWGIPYSIYLKGTVCSLTFCVVIPWQTQPAYSRVQNVTKLPRPRFGMQQLQHPRESQKGMPAPCHHSPAGLLLLCHGMQTCSDSLKLPATSGFAISWCTVLRQLNLHKRNAPVTLLTCQAPTCEPSRIEKRDLALKHGPR